MKKMRKIFAILMTMIMVMGFATTVSAAETTTYKYDIYQIFTGEFKDNKLSNVSWGKNGKGSTAAELTAAMNALEAVNVEGASNQDKLDVIMQYANLETAPYATFNTTELNATFDLEKDGYYLVKDQTDSQTGNSAYTTYVVKVVNGTLTFNRKADVPKVDKFILDPNRMTSNEASIGEKVNYEIVGTLPSNLADYETYFYKFTDTLSKGLTYNYDAKVFVNGVDVTSYFWVEPTNYDATNGTTITISIQDLLALELVVDDAATTDKNEAVGAITKDTTVVIKYSATLNENAVIAGAGNPNKVDLEYSNDPNNSGVGATNPPNPPETPPTPDEKQPTGKTPESVVVTYTTELTITKRAEAEDGVILPGVEFTLTSNDGAKVVVVKEQRYVEDAEGTFYKLNDGTYTETAPTEETKDSYASTTDKYALQTFMTTKGEGQGEQTTILGVVGDDGKLTFSGLGVGTYTLTETEALPGYNVIEPIRFTVTFDATTTQFASNNDDIVLENDNTFATTVINNKGAVLPETGGIGTTMFYVIGSIMVLGTAVVMISRKRMDV